MLEVHKTYRYKGTPEKTVTVKGFDWCFAMRLRQVVFDLDGEIRKVPLDQVEKEMHLFELVDDEQ